MPETKQIPLVVYNRGVRSVLGMVVVGDDGSFHGQVTRDAWPIVKDRFQPNVGEFSVNPAPMRPMTPSSDKKT